MTTQQPADGFYLRNAASGLVVRDGHALLVRGTWPDPGSETYWLPGGGQQPGETLAACAEREVLEETGVRVTAGQNPELATRATAGTAHAFYAGDVE
ncbi:NUDIX domain-containing protein [Streptomyces roseoverticillatus]|uniref:NUDIX domain-containing protein n=1 Tax=Streptomyces roseoverticillatus TaxID=66429 RepID=UPI001F301C75|nr:NUDIX domain-containing protein [Streptomyces roseoverticillatus]MCF3103065.1 NUDIX domain-containing protein [Streptomyces roseoverticillatus]